MKPYIGITCNYDFRDAIGEVTHAGPDNQDWSFLASDYVRAISNAGGIPVLLPQLDEPGDAPDLLGRLDGLLLSGGNDISPFFYGEEIRDCSGMLFPMRDELELLLAKEALRRKLPILGICRGFQILNVALGGTLYQDLSENGSFGQHAVYTVPKALPAHEVLLEEGTQLAAIYGKGRLAVNSFHHQAVKRLPEGALPAARARDGLIESAEFVGGHPFTIGVQWHPEMMQQQSDEQKKLFAAFVSACGK